MLDVVLDTLIDSVKLIPFLFITYFAMEYLEHKTSGKTKQMIRNAGKTGPIIGGVLGAFPQCGFSTAASNLYAGRVITMGTLVAIFLSTSDEMLPVFLSEKVPVSTILALIGIKVVIGIIAGLVVDVFIAHNGKGGANAMRKIGIGNVCVNDKCNCQNGIFLSSLKHTAITGGFILLISFVLNLVIFFIGEDTLAAFLLNKPVIGPMVAGIVGMIPNCAASVVITQLYLKNAMSLGAAMAGLLAGSGVGILVLFKENRNLKNNLTVLGILYAVGLISGILLDLISGL